MDELMMDKNLPYFVGGNLATLATILKVLFKKYKDSPELHQFEAA